MNRQCHALIVVLLSVCSRGAFASQWCVVDKLGNELNCSAFIDPCQQQASFIGGACVMQVTPARQAQPSGQSDSSISRLPPIPRETSSYAAGVNPSLRLLRLRTCELASSDASATAQHFADLMKYLREFADRVAKKKVTRKEQEQAQAMVKEEYAAANDRAFAKSEEIQKAFIDKIPANASALERQSQTAIALMVGGLVKNVFTDATLVGSDNGDAPPERFVRLLRQHCESEVSSEP